MRETLLRVTFATILLILFGSHTIAQMPNPYGAPVGVENAKKAAQTRADAQKRATWCKDARAELSALSSDQLLVAKVNEKGTTVYLDDAERKRRREALESNLKTNNCPRG